MGPEAKELMAFYKALFDNPNDLDTRQDLADWFDEHDEPEEAVALRAWCKPKARERREAEAYVREFCKRYSADYDDFLEAIENGDGYCFGDDDGPWAAREDEQLWKSLKALLKKEPERDQSFSCGC